MCACVGAFAGVCAGTPHFSFLFFFALLLLLTAADTTTMRVWTTAMHVWHDVCVYSLCVCVLRVRTATVQQQSRSKFSVDHFNACVDITYTCVVCDVYAMIRKYMPSATTTTKYYTLAVRV